MCGGRLGRVSDVGISERAELPMRLRIGRIGRSMIAAVAALIAAGLTGVSACASQTPPNPSRSSVHLPDESAGVDAIVRALIGAYDQADVVALGEWHGRIAVDSALRIALVRHPDFAKRVRSIVIECASATEQATLDRYIRGENVPRNQLQRVWKATEGTTNGFCDDPPYPAFLAAVRDVNAKLPPNTRIRVLGGHPGPSGDIEKTAVSVLKTEVFAKHGKALLIFGSAHFYRNFPSPMLGSMGDDIGLVRRLETEFPGRTLVVTPIGPLNPPRGVSGDIVPDFSKFDRALTTPIRPVMVSLQRPPFRDLSAEEFLGRTVTTCSRDRGCASLFAHSALTLGQIADAGIYVGGGGDARPASRP